MGELGSPVRASATAELLRMRIGFDCDWTLIAIADCGLWIANAESGLRLRTADSGLRTSDFDEIRIVAK
eukprot:1972597-Alexandrium_andersonii.AAC.1